MFIGTLVLLALHNDIVMVRVGGGWVEGTQTEVELYLYPRYPIDALP